MKNNKGITMISLITLIVILLILAGIVTKTGIEVYSNAKFTAFTSELKIMQTEVNELYDMHINGKTINVNGIETNIIEIGQELRDAKDISKIKLILNSDEDVSGYRIYTVDFIDNTLETKAITREFFVNVEKRSAIAIEGLEYKGEMYYMLEQIPNSGYNVEYSPVSYDKPTFSYDINDDILEIYNIQYNGYINKWDVYYKKVEDSNYIKTDLKNIQIKETGEYNLKIGNGDIYSEEITVTKVNEPILVDNMIKGY